MISNKLYWSIFIFAVLAASGINLYFISKAGAEIENIGSNIINTKNKESNMAILKTNKGEIEIEFFDSLAPNTVANFIKLAKSGFYDGVKFHRVIEGFMIQGGDPLSKDDSLEDKWGQGGPGYMFADEIHSENRNVIGTISMANAGANTNGSQFFINVADNDFLDGKHTVFGKVVSGMDVVMAISKVQVEYSSPMAPQPDRPVEPIVIEKVVLK